MQQGMTRRSALYHVAGGLALSACTADSAKPDATQAVPPPSTPSTIDFETPMEGSFNLYVSNHRPLAMLSLDDNIPVPVMFDTGTSGSMIDISVFEKLGLTRKLNHQSFITDATGTTVEAFAAQVEAPRLGAIVAAAQGIDVSTYRDGDEYGILGPPLYSGSAVYMNMPRQRVYVRKAFDEAVVVPDAKPYGDDNLPYGSVFIDGLPEMQGLIDTGKNGTMSFPEEMMDSLPLIGRPEEVGMATTVFKSVPVYGAKLDASVRVGTHTIDRPDVIFHGHAPKIGMPFLEHLRFWQEPHRRRSWFLTPQDLPAELAKSIVGDYGERRMWVDENGLNYQKEGRPVRQLRYQGADHFLFEYDQTDLILRRNDRGDVSGYTLLGSSGDPYEVQRTS